MSTAAAGSSTSARTAARGAPRAPTSLRRRGYVQRARLGARIERTVDRPERDREHVLARQFRVPPGRPRIVRHPEPGAAATRRDPLGPARIDSDALKPGSLEQRLDVGLGNADERAPRRDDEGHG